MTLVGGRERVDGIGMTCDFILRQFRISILINFLPSGKLLKFSNLSFIIKKMGLMPPRLQDNLEN